MTRTIGGVLLVLGALLLVLSLFQDRISITTKEKVLDAGPVEITRDKKTSLPIVPWVGVGAMVAGGIALASGRRSA
jgi:hypothetical protein